MTYLSDTQQILPANHIADVVIDEQVVVQTELESHLEEQAKLIAPEKIATVEISFYDYEIYAGNKLIACITYDQNDFVTQPWLVMVNGVEIHRVDTWAKCHSYIQWHYKQGTLPVQNQDFNVSVTTDNEVMAQIATECEKFEFDLYDDGIYHNDIKLGEVGCTEGQWWVLQTSSQQQEKLTCNSASDAVWSLWMVEVSFEEAAPSTSTPNINQELLDRPFDELSDTEWGLLKKHEALPENVVLVAA